jgi:hypothetical protein
VNQIITLLLLRAKQGYRFLHEIGFGFILFALFILTGFIFSALQNILTAPPIGALFLIIILLLGIETKRGDRFFLTSIFDTKMELIRYKFIENIMIALPIIVFQGIFQRWDIILDTMAICSLIAFLSLYINKPKQKERKTSLTRIPLSLFEIKFYFERRMSFFIIAWLLLCLGGFHISLWILGIFIFCTITLDIYTPSESREMVVYQPHFIRHKLSKGVGFFLLFIAIPSIITLLFSTEHYLVLIYGTIALILSTTLAICKKYASYYGVNQKIHATTSTMILVLLMLAPGGILITFSACIYYYFQAEKHMKNIYAVI